MSDALFVGALAAFADVLCWVEEAPGDGATDLRPHLRSYQASVGGPWRASCSLFAQVYFNTLLIPATCWLAQGLSEDAVACRLAPRFCAGGGAPSGFALCGKCRGDPAPDIAFLTLLEGHLSGVIDELTHEARLSPRMLWESAATSLRWTAAELSARPSIGASRLQSLAARASGNSRLASVWREGEGQGCGGARRFCCLRYQLPGASPCPNICPRDNRRKAPSSAE